MATVEESLLHPHSYVGFESITSQIERRLLKRGFQFNLMVVGQSGLGKSTFINTLFATHLVDSLGRKEPTEDYEKTCSIEVTSRIVQEGPVKLRLNIIDTPGYGDQVNNDKCWEPIVKYIKDQHSSYLRKELTAKREQFLPDTRVHCVLYFIQPTGHGLKPIDVTVMKKLTEAANVVPVIAKSDSLTMAERAHFKEVLRKEFATNGFKLYPQLDESGTYMDAEDEQLNEAVRAMIPFAVVGSSNVYEIGGKTIRGRRNRWGLVNVEDENHCEFPQLRKFLIATHLQDLIESTSLVHYEQFRSKQLISLKEQAHNNSNNTNGSTSGTTTSKTGPAAVPASPEK